MLNRLDMEKFFAILAVLADPEKAKAELQNITSRLNDLDEREKALVTGQEEANKALSTARAERDKVVELHKEVVTLRDEALQYRDHGGKLYVAARALDEKNTAQAASFLTQQQALEKVEIDLNNRATFILEKEQSLSKRELLVAEREKDVSERLNKLRQFVA